jgi:hypothetical protein
VSMLPGLVGLFGLEVGFEEAGAGCLEGSSRLCLSRALLLVVLSHSQPGTNFLLPPASRRQNA